MVFIECIICLLYLSIGFENDRLWDSPGHTEIPGLCLKRPRLERLHVYGHIDGHLVNSNALKLFNIRLFDTSFLHYLSKKNIILWKM